MSGGYYHNMKHLVTSGCSFSDNAGKRWPHFLAEVKNFNLYNKGQGSCGNEWIADSIIYQTKKLLADNILPENIIVTVCWSGIDRKSHFISKSENVRFTEFININGGYNPVSFIENPANVQQPAINKGWLVGGYNCRFDNKNINLFKQEYFEKYYSEEESLITSLKHWLMLQWFCETHNIRLFNFTYMDIFKYKNVVFYEKYPDTKYYFDMLNMKNWWFYKNYGGLYEWSKDNNLIFDDDNVHPASSTHKKFVDEILSEVI